MEVFTKLPGVIRVLGKGDTKSSIEFGDGVRAQVWVHPPERFGTALLYATGSKEHNVRLREIALAKGLSLSEHALTKEKGEGDELLYATEEKYTRRWVCRGSRRSCEKTGERYRRPRPTSCRS